MLTFKRFAQGQAPFYLRIWLEESCARVCGQILCACKTWRGWRQVAAAQRLSTDSRIEESRFFKVFTKLRALEQIDFEKVLVMDIDLLVARPQKVI